ncbi:hypothetical protein Dsin_006970 [Dipteronia sinensis]|uniref:DUF659 domain-containing protein n=1 Tax=Dipteronia sinensis TaxID=43782 RepID=A0AAE0EG26_9ROSI|nr:hypothetical protein Dsin_006970 [Dipteronia sinensis]
MLKSGSCASKGISRIDLAWKHCKDVEHGDGKSYKSLGDYGQGYKVPSCYDLSTWVFQKEVETTNTIDDVNKIWKTTGVTIMSDSWTDIRRRSLLNFLANNPKGTIFLKTIDASNMVKDADLIFHLIDDVWRKMGKTL